TLPTQHSSGLCDSHLRSTVRPAAAQGEIHPKTKLTTFGRGEAQGVEELVREKRQSSYVLLIVQSKWINWLNLKAANAAFFHHPHLALEFRLGNGRSEPPPSHHDSTVGRRILKERLQLADIGCKAGLYRWRSVVSCYGRLRQ